MIEKQRWWQAEKTKVHSKVFEYVRQVEVAQWEYFNRFVQLASLYDPNSTTTLDGTKPDGFVTENVIATNVDTITAIIASTSLRARVMTDDGDWDQQRTARRQELYEEALEKTYEVEAKAITAFGHGPGIRGTGAMYVNVESGKLVVEHVLADDLVVPDVECRNGRKPRQIHRRKLVDRDDLKAQFPKFAVEIDKAQSSQDASRLWAGYRPMAEYEVVVIHSHRLAIGTKGEAGYAPGRETVTIDGCDLLDVEWEQDFLPYARIVWAERDNSWYGISLAERLVGHQQVLNRSNYQIDRLVNLNAIPTTYCSYADLNSLSMKVQRPGMMVGIKGQMPQTPTPPSINPEVMNRAREVKASASEESGVNRMLSNGAKPAGLDSGAALRELRDSTTQRFSTQEKAYEQFRADIAFLMLAACKRLGKKAPTVTQRTRFGLRKIQWSKVDLGDLKVRITMASGLPRTVAGRTQMVLEWAQAGLIDTDESRRLLRHPDLERSLSLFTAGVEALEHAFDLIADGEIVMPEPFMHLDACVKRGQMQYLEWWKIGAPEEVMEAIRQFVVQAADMAAPKPMPMAPGVANDNAMPMDPMLADPMAANMNMPLPPMPGEAPPQAALAGSAMNLRAV